MPQKKTNRTLEGWRKLQLNVQNGERQRGEIYSHQRGCVCVCARTQIHYDIFGENLVDKEIITIQSTLTLYKSTPS